MKYPCHSHHRIFVQSTSYYIKVLFLLCCYSLHLKTQSIMTWILCVVFDTGYVGKTAWTSTGSTWSGRRYLVKADNNTSLTIERGDVKDSSSDEGLLSTLPSWCSFKGKISCCTDNWYRKCGFSYDSIFYCDLIRFDLIWFVLIWFLNPVDLSCTAWLPCTMCLVLI